MRRANLGGARKWLSLLQFFPLSLFATFAFWHGAPSGQRWMQAFELSALAGLVQVLILARQPTAMNRLLLGANLYLIVGGLAALTGQIWLLEGYGQLAEAGIFVAILAVGVVTTLASDAGFVPVAGLGRGHGRWASWVMLSATGVALLCAMHFRGDRLLAAVLPIVSLALLQRVLAYRLAAQSDSTISPVSTVANPR